MRSRLPLSLLLLCACGAPAPEPREEPASAGAESSADVQGEPEVEAAPEPASEAEEEPQLGEPLELAEGAPPTEDEEEPVNPDSISDTPSHATFTHCDPEPAADCEDCGVRVSLRRRRGWRPAEYRFEILTEGNHIRCRVSLPCDDPQPVECRASPGAPQVTVETSGCAEGDGELAALRFEPAACPAEMRIESYRDGIRTGVQDWRPRYQDGAATTVHALER